MEFYLWRNNCSQRYQIIFEMLLNEIDPITIVEYCRMIWKRYEVLGHATFEKNTPQSKQWIDESWIEENYTRLYNTTLIN